MKLEKYVIALSIAILLNLIAIWSLSSRVNMLEKHIEAVIDA